MSDVFIEVKEAMKQERMEKFWNKYGVLVIGAAVVVIGATAWNEGYKAWKADHNKNQTAIFVEALDAKDPAALQTTSENLSDGLKTLAQLKLAGEYINAGDKKAAQKTYQDIINDKKAVPEFRQLAEYSLIRADDTMNADQRVLALSGIWADEKNPWRYHARLDAAVILANDLQKYTESRAQLAILLGEQAVPSTLAQKATSLDILYGLKESALEQDSASAAKQSANVQN